MLQLRQHTTIDGRQGRSASWDHEYLVIGCVAIKAEEELTHVRVKERRTHRCTYAYPPDQHMHGWPPCLEPCMRGSCAHSAVRKLVGTLSGLRDTWPHWEEPRPRERKSETENLKLHVDKPLPYYTNTYLVMSSISTHSPALTHAFRLSAPIVSMATTGTSSQDNTAQNTRIIRHRNLVHKCSCICTYQRLTGMCISRA